LRASGKMIAPSNTLLCIFSYNMGPALRTCLRSIQDMCAGFSVVLVDDASEDLETLRIIAEHRGMFVDVFRSTEDKTGKRHGNLYSNIQRMYEYAHAHGWTYLFLIQDDMQFVRPFSEDVRRQYSALFDSSPHVTQVDPRFLRRGGDYEVLPDRRAYRYDQTTSYADVGITHVARLQELNWRFQEGERKNRDGLTALGCQRLFPFTPVMSHVPFPTTFRKGRRKTSLMPFNRGRYRYRYMTDAEIALMDRRPVEQPPFFRTFLKPANMRLSRIFYEMRKDTKVFN
jgi:glycosyltransferase involved in cell wall biosynthesis